MNWIELNNQVIIKDEFGRYQLEKDKEALKSYIEEYVKPKLMKFNSLEERLSYSISFRSIPSHLCVCLSSVFPSLSMAILIQNHQK